MLPPLFATRGPAPSLSHYHHRICLPRRVESVPGPGQPARGPSPPLAWLALLCGWKAAMRPPGQRTRRLGALALRALLPLLVASALWSLATAPQGALGRGRRGLLEADAGTALVPGSGSSSGVTLARAAAAVQLEQRIDADPLLGACYQQTPLLPGVPEWACQDLHCLWSEAGQQNVDLFLSPLQAMSSGAVPGLCPEPRGGQRPLPAGGAPVVSFVVTMHNNAEVGRMEGLDGARYMQRIVWCPPQYF